MPIELKRQNNSSSSPALDDAEDRTDPRDQKTYYLHVTPLRFLVTEILREAFKLISIREIHITSIPLSMSTQITIAINLYQHREINQSNY